METITVFAGNRSHFEDVIAKAQKRWPNTIRVESVTERTEQHWEDGEKVDVPVLDFLLSCAADEWQIKGFKFIGGVKWDGSIPLVYTARGNEETNLLDRVDINQEFKCYHCNRTIQNRVQKLFFENTNDNNTIVNFGSDCASRYFGEDMLDKLMKGISILQSMMEDSSEYGLGIGNAGMKMIMFRNVSRTAIAMFKAGAIYVSKKKEQEAYDAGLRCPSSLTVINEYLNAVREMNRGQDWAKKFVQEFQERYPLDIDYEGEMAKIEQYLEAKEVKSDFDFNMKNQIKGGSAYGVIVFAIYSYYRQFRDMENLPEKEKIGTEYYPVEVGVRFTVADAECVGRYSYESAYGMNWITSFKVGSYLIVNFGQINSCDIEIGKHYKLAATKKKEQEYNGKKQTVVSRVKATEIAVVSE